VDGWNNLQGRIVTCTRCPRLRDHCTRMATEKRAAFRDEDYWGKPLPNLGEPSARLLLVGLAPAAHGANRTGRMFTGDRSGDFLFRAMYETGFANQPESVRHGDGLELIDAAVTGVAHCAPPANKPLPMELANCAAFLRETLDLMPHVRVVLALGRIAFDACLRLYAGRGWFPPGTPKPVFGHGAVYRLAPSAPVLVASFHPSQQNTFTGRLTPAMMRGVFETCRTLLKAGPRGAGSVHSTPPAATGIARRGAAKKRT
jgi:uracil-DNA glycosylase family 4